MYNSHSYQNESFQFFTTFLRTVIDGNKNYEALVIPIIKEAHLLAKGDKDYFSVDRDGYSIITFLAESDNEYFKDLNVDQISNEDYERILNIANYQRESLYM